MNRTLTEKQKAIYLPILIRRDGGFICFYCKKNLVNLVWIYEHLNNNPQHNKIENIVLACQSCNLKKKNDFDMQIKAMEKLKQNQEANLSCERECVEQEAPTLSIEIDVNQQNFEIVHQYLAEIIKTDGSIEVKDVIDSASMLCKKKTGHGGQVSVRRYIDMLTSREGPFMIVKNDEGKRIIVKRAGQ